MTKKRLGKTITRGTRRKSYKKKTKNAGLTRLYYFGISTKKNKIHKEKNHREHDETRLVKLTGKHSGNSWKPTFWLRTLRDLASNTHSDQIRFRCAPITPGNDKHRNRKQN